ncbi:MULTISPECIES: hypothetical protein [Luteimonas]|uniref:hypothetical protein n=1 Tax=Luteimonas TaxID=83614 RepID=UPI000C7C8C49|nr:MULTISPECIES: hypothetical protein [Luteimonas]
MRLPLLCCLSAGLLVLAACDRRDDQELLSPDPADTTMPAQETPPPDSAGGITANDPDNQRTAEPATPPAEEADATPSRP